MLVRDRADRVRGRVLVDAAERGIVRHRQDRVARMRPPDVRAHRASLSDVVLVRVEREVRRVVGGLSVPLRPERDRRTVLPAADHPRADPIGIDAERLGRVLGELFERGDVLLELADGLLKARFLVAAGGFAVELGAEEVGLGGDAADAHGAGHDQARG